MKKGQRILAEIIEIQRDKQILVAVEGRLLRVTNRSHQQFSLHEKINLIVVSESPLELKIESSAHGFERLV